MENMNRARKVWLTPKEILQNQDTRLPTMAVSEGLLPARLVSWDTKRRYLSVVAPAKNATRSSRLRRMYRILHLNALEDAPNSLFLCMDMGRNVTPMTPLVWRDLSALS